MKSHIVALLLLGTVALAQEQPSSSWASNEVVVITAQKSGPAFWHVKKGDSEIWILGSAAPLIEGISFNDDHIGETIKGARVLLLPPIGSMAPLSTGWFLLTHRGLLSIASGNTLETTLPTDLRERFVVARTALNIGPGKYEDDAPIVVAIRLRSAYNKAHKLVGDAAATVAKMHAKQQSVPIKTIGEYDAIDLLKEMLRLPQASQQKCLANTITYTELANVHAKPLSEAWVVGDLKGIKAHFVTSGFKDCLKQAGSFSKIEDRAVADYLKVIHEALSQPGKVVMVADIGDLLQSTGIAEALHKEGVTIEGPAE